MQPGFVPYAVPDVAPEEMAQRARAFHAQMDGRRTVRRFSSKPVPRSVLEDAIRTAGTAPSGAHKQPWTYVVVEDADVRRRLRDVAEQEERRFYEQVAPDEWLRDLAPLGTDWVKAHLTDAPWLVVVFAQDYELRPDGAKGKHYYVNESVGISVGFFLAALRMAGVCALTHTPSPMGWLKRELKRPDNERAYVVVPVGFPAEDATVPDLRRKPLDAISAWV
jgi:iodotyrosine deiodinase